MAFHWLRDIPAEIRLEVYKAYFSTITISPHSGFTKCCWRNQCENLVLSLLLASKTVYIEAQPLAWNFVTIKLTACTSSSRWLLTDKTWKRATKVLQSGLKLRVSSSRTLFEFEFGLPSITQLSKFNIQQLDLPYMQVCLNDDCVERVYRLLEKGIQKVVVGFLTIEVRAKALVGPGLLQIRRQHGIHIIAANEEKLGNVKTFVEGSNAIKNKDAVSYALEDHRAIHDWLDGGNQALA